jgi:hypothetical protein
MKFKEFEKALSKARLSRYLSACNGDETKALSLYKLNIRLSEKFYAILSLFEVTLRNAIDIHYSLQFNDREWLKNQCTGNGFLNNPAFAGNRFKAKKIVDENIRSLGVQYNHDRLLATLSFGFWVNLYAPMQFRFAGQTLHEIFINRNKGTKPKDLYNDLLQILEFRNRIAHHEPICFNRTHQIDVSSPKLIHNLILQKTEWLGFVPNDFFIELDNIEEVLNAIMKLKSAQPQSL